MFTIFFLHILQRMGTRRGLSVKPEDLLGGTVIVLVSDRRDKRLTKCTDKYAHTRTNCPNCLQNVALQETKLKNLP